MRQLLHLSTASVAGGGRVRGRLRQRGRAASVVLVVLALLAPSAARADAPPARIIDVVGVTWAGAPAPTATPQDVVHTVSTDTIARWQTISGGRVQFSLGQVLPTVTTNVPLPCDASGSQQYLGAVALAAYQRAGITDTSHHYLIEVAPNPPGGCIWDGRGIVGQPGSTSGLLILRDNADPTVIAHELGHNLGLGHSNLERCSGGRADGPWADCTAVEYGSATDLMGNTPRTSPLSAYHQWRLGWLSDLDVAIGNRDETVTLHSVDSPTPPVDAAGHYVPLTRAIFVRDKTAAYWVEFRHADPANGIKQGLVLYRTDPPPASSVSSPIASDAADPTSMNVTTDVWMINLGDWAYPSTTGSPSLAPDTSFTTAFGGATLSAHVNPDGTATVTVHRAGPVVPGAPTWTDASTWRNADAPVTDATLDDGGLAITGFQGEITDASGTRVIAVPRSDPSSAWSRTYLTPVGVPPIVTLGSLPEGTYSLRLRAVNAAGTAGAWSTPRAVHIDRGAPVVSSRFAVTAVTPGRSVSLAWTGATDAGSGICTAQVVNADQWAVAGWHSGTGVWKPGESGVPRFTLGAGGAGAAAFGAGAVGSADVSGDGQVFDCVGNGVDGSLALTSGWVPALAWTRSGTWRAVRMSGADVRVGGLVLHGAAGAASGGSATVVAGAGGATTATSTSESVPALRCASTCTATTITAAGTSLVLVGSGAATVRVDGRVVRRLPATRASSAARIAYTVTDRHRVVVSGAGAVLVGLQRVALSWQQTGLIAGVAHPADASLSNPTQQLLSQVGFGQSDFADTAAVTPISNGTTLQDATLDFCAATYPSDKLRIARRQVAVSWQGSPYSFVSTETVRYQSAAAVRQAITELDAAATQCRTRGYAVGAAGQQQPYVFHDLPTSLPSGLRPAADTRAFYVQMGDTATATTFLLVYQFDGDTLNAMYVARSGSWTLTPDDVTRWLGVAGVLGSRLTDAVTRGVLSGRGVGAA